MRIERWRWWALCSMLVGCASDSAGECKSNADCLGVAVCVDRVCLPPAVAESTCGDACSECTGDSDCDDGEVCYGELCQPLQAACNQCVVLGCESETVTCSDNPDCVPLMECVGDCAGAETCVQGCANARSAGVPDANALYECVGTCSVCGELTNQLAGLEGDGSSSADERFVDQGYGVVRDRDTGLLWEQLPAQSEFTWDAAFEHCQGLQLAEITGWRVPTIAELLTLLTTEAGTGGEYYGGCYWNPTFQGDCQSSPYWSASDAGSDGVATVGFYLGRPSTSLRELERYVRCVSSGT